MPRPNQILKSFEKPRTILLRDQGKPTLKRALFGWSRDPKMSLRHCVPTKPVLFGPVVPDADLGTSGGDFQPVGFSRLNP